MWKAFRNFQPGEGLLRDCENRSIVCSSTIYRYWSWLCSMVGVCPPDIMPTCWACMSTVLTFSAAQSSTILVTPASFTSFSRDLRIQTAWGPARPVEFLNFDIDTFGRPRLCRLGITFYFRHIVVHVSTQPPLFQICCNSSATSMSESHCSVLRRANYYGPNSFKKASFLT